MRFGSPWPAGYGQPTKAVSLEFPAAPRTRAGQVSIPTTVRVRTTMGPCSVGIYRNGRWFANVYVAEGEPFYLTVPREAGQTKTSIWAFRLGHAASCGYINNRMCQPDEERSSTRVAITWDWVPYYAGTVPDTEAQIGKLTGWALTSYKYDYLGH